MNKIKAITIEDDIDFLRQVSKEVVLTDSELENDIKILDEYCMENSVMAMAAIQLGINKRIIYLKNTNLDVINKIQNNEEVDNVNERRILINPVIKNRIGVTEYWEACASCLNKMGLVRRPYKIELEYLDLGGNKHCETFVGFESTVLSHEYDHLNGVLHIDKSLEIYDMDSEERKVFRRDHPYKIIYENGSFEKLKDK